MYVHVTHIMIHVCIYVVFIVSFMLWLIRENSNYMRGCYLEVGRLYKGNLCGGADLYIDFGKLYIRGCCTNHVIAGGR